MRNVLIVLFMLPVAIFGQVQVADVFSSNMVLQRDQDIVVWGKARPGDLVEVYLGGHLAHSTATHDSVWTVVLPAQKINRTGQQLTVSCGDSSVSFENVLIGDVWVCIGQSNMEWPMRKELHWKEEMTVCDHPEIRLCNPPPAGRYVYGARYTDSLVSRLNLEKFYDWDAWFVSDSSSVSSMSAVAYYFAREVNARTGIPIGIINLSIGGAPLESFISKEALLSDPKFRAKVSGNWLENDALPVWVKERGVQNVGQLAQVPSDDTGPFHAYKPGFAYEAGIKPLFQMPVKGILCYQGESNSQEIRSVNEYAELSALMVSDFRKNWKTNDLPFYFVQLSSIDTTGYKSQFWGEFRDEQRKMLATIPFSGMAVCSDIGAFKNVHPTNKKSVGERLARWALNLNYKLDVTPSGPLALKAVYSRNQVEITFDYAHSGLKTSDGGLVHGFSLDGYNEVEASFFKGKVMIPVRKKPAFVYYGWKPYSDGNVVNAENLPMSTFRLAVE